VGGNPGRESKELTESKQAGCQPISSPNGLGVICNSQDLILEARVSEERFSVGRPLPPERPIVRKVLSQPAGGSGPRYGAYPRDRRFSSKWRLCDQLLNPSQPDIDI